jgi:hypothetical protein
MRDWRHHQFLKRSSTLIIIAVLNLPRNTKKMSGSLGVYRLASCMIETAGKQDAAMQCGTGQAPARSSRVEGRATITSPLHARRSA